LITQKNWKIQWLAAFEEMRDINRMTSGNLSFANQAAAQDIVQAEKMAAWPDSLADTSIQKNNTIDKLVGMNQQQAEIITDLKAAIAKLKDGSPHTGPRPGQGHPPHWSPTKLVWDTMVYC
jgi:hypothetical protein